MHTIRGLGIEVEAAFRTSDHSLKEQKYLKYWLQKVAHKATGNYQQSPSVSGT